MCRAGQEEAPRRCPSVHVPPCGSPSLASSLGVECKSQPKSLFVLPCPLLLLRGEAQGNRLPVLGSGRGVRAAACQAFIKRPPFGPELGGGWHGRPLRPRRSGHCPLPAFAREPGQPRAVALPALGTGFLSPQPRWPLRSPPPLY